MQSDVLPPDVMRADVIDDDVVGIVLAGGRGSRLGHTAPADGKGALQFRGRSFLEIVVAAVGTEAGCVVVVAAPGQHLPPLPAAVRVVRDTRPGAGPLAAVRDGLAAAVDRAPGANAAFIASCDLPRVRADVVRAILDRQRATGAWVVPVVAGRPQPLASALPLAGLAWIERHLAAGGRDFRSLLAGLAATTPPLVEYCAAEGLAPDDPALESFRDIDTPADVAWLRDRENPPSAG